MHNDLVCGISADTLKLVLGDLRSVRVGINGIDVDFIRTGNLTYIIT